MEGQSSPEDRGAERRLESLKAEVDALQVEVMGGKAPWYRQVSVVVPMAVAVAAFVFSLVTTVIAERRIDRENEHETRIELRQLVQRLVALPAENFTINRKYADDPGASVYITGLLNQELVVLASQASDLITDLAGEVSASEYNTVAAAYRLAGQTASAEDLLRVGIRETRSESRQDLVGFGNLVRSRALLAYDTEDRATGQRFFAWGLRLYEELPANDPARANGLAYTHQAWAFAEQGAGNCSVAEVHLLAAQELIPYTTIGPVDQGIRRSLAKLDETCPTGGTRTPPG